MLDTDVFSALYITPSRIVAKQAHPVERWRTALTGRRPLIAFQTRAEVLSGALLVGWGEARLGMVRRELDATPTVDIDRDVVESYAELLSAAKRMGHPLGDKSRHVGDRWIAACAIAKELPLLTGNRKHFAGAPGLVLLDD
ncbi:PIN domain-containing protein [Microbacterium sp. KNMS]